MLNIFVESEDIIKINFTIAVSDTEKVYADISRSDLEQMLTGIKCTFEDHYIVFKRPSFKDIVNMSQGLKSDGTGFSIDILPDRYNKVVALLRQWSFLSPDESPAPLTTSNIDKLHPVVAELIISQLDLELGGSLM
jgi:hypothetical protein